MQREKTKLPRAALFVSGRGVQCQVAVLGVLGIGMRRIADKRGAGARVAFTASPDQIHLRDGRLRVGAGKNVVSAMTIPTVRRLHVTESRYLCMEGAVVGLVPVPVAAAACRRGFHLKRQVADIGDLVRGVTEWCTPGLACCRTPALSRARRRGTLVPCPDGRRRKSPERWPAKSGSSGSSDRGYRVRRGNLHTWPPPKDRPRERHAVN